MKYIGFLLLIIIFVVLTFAKGNQQCYSEKGCTEDTGTTPVTLESYTENNLKKERAARFKDINNLPALNDRLYLLEDDELPQILWWYDFYPHRGSSDKDLIKCKLGNCKISNDEKELSNPLTRGIIFYGTSVYADTLPLPRLPHHEWGVVHEESPTNQWMFSDEIGISIFNHTATFRRESDYPISTFAMNDPEAYFDGPYYVPTGEKNRLQKEEGFAPAVFVQRNCNPSSDRDTYISELMKYLPIDAYGPCLNNKEIPEKIRGFAKLASKEYFQFLAKYKFQIAFENAVCQDYTTEKLVRPLKVGSVPIYYGSPKAEDFMPSKKAVIMVNDFKSPKELAEYIIMLNEDDVKYEEYLQHRLIDKKITNPEFLKALGRQPWKIPHRAHHVNFGSYMMQGFSCHVCDQLHERNNMLKEHLKDSRNPIKPSRIGKYEHMGCPRPFPILPTSKKNRRSFMHFDNARPEAEALAQMLQANETDAKKYPSKYLKIFTDKYPKPR